MAGATTQADRQAQVLAAGYNGPMNDAAINQAYANAATPGDLASSGLSNTPQSSPGASPATIPGSPGTVTGTNAALDANILSSLQAKAQQEYLNAKLQLDSDQEAYQKAAQSIANDLSIAGVTGTYQGQPTQQAIKQLADIAQQQAATMLSYATTFGTWGTPQQGQQTMAAQKQASDEAISAAGVTGWYTPPAYSPVPPITQPTAGGAGAGQVSGTGYFIGTDGRIHVGSPTGTGQAGYDPNTPGGGSGLMAAQGWAPGTQSSNPQAFLSAPQAAATTTPGQAPTTAGQPGAQAPQMTQSYWQAQQTAAQNYLTMLTNLRGPADYAKYQQVLGATPGGMKDLVAAAAGQYIPGGGATTGVQPQAANLSNFLGGAVGPQDTSGQAAMNSLVAPNQMAPQTWNALTPSQQQMLLGQWESQGYTKDDAQALFNQSLPKYGTNAPAAGQFKLQ